jgi:hypothetical protein
MVPISTKIHYVFHPMADLMVVPGVNTFMSSILIMAVVIKVHMYICQMAKEPLLDILENPMVLYMLAVEEAEENQVAAGMALLVAELEEEEMEDAMAMVSLAVQIPEAVEAVVILGNLVMHFGHQLVQFMVAMAVAA